VRPRLYAYMGGILSTLDTVPEIVGGVEDHVHILLGLRRVEACLMSCAGLKALRLDGCMRKLGLKVLRGRRIWTFTVGASQREMVRRYIARQEEHHRKRTFKEEYLDFLQRSGLILIRVIFSG